ncbi:MAG: phosphotransferase [Rhodobacteraceae bacterium]|nr:phosphotransferase [Paracoccaceae bacterium]
MTGRGDLAAAFLDKAGWAGATRAALAGDASNRRYERLTARETGASAVLMDAPASRGEDVRPFLAIARHLSGIGLSAPQVMAADPENGFLLIEDLGDALFARVVVARPDLEPTLYRAATDVLVHLHRHPPPEALQAYDAPRMTDLAALALDKYRAILRPDDPALRAAFTDRFAAILQQAAAPAGVLIQRDYHAENLLWLPEREGVARVGLLDFQDAMQGHPAYDLVSLLQDARRDVPAQIETEMIERYITATRMDPGAFRTAYAVLGVQRNLRILGVFARLCTDYGKPHYVDLIPRVWRHVTRGLSDPALAPVADLLSDALPPPCPETLSRIRSQCNAPRP